MRNVQDRGGRFRRGREGLEKLKNCGRPQRSNPRRRPFACCSSSSVVTTEAPTNRNNDDATLLILIIVCSVAVFCCLLALGTAAAPSVLLGAVPASRRKRRRRASRKPSAALGTDVARNGGDIRTITATHGRDPGQRLRRWRRSRRPRRGAARNALKSPGRGDDWPSRRPIPLHIRVHTRPVVGAASWRKSLVSSLLRTAKQQRLAIKQPREAARRWCELADAWYSSSRPSRHQTVAVVHGRRPRPARCVFVCSTSAAALLLLRVSPSSPNEPTEFGLATAPAPASPAPARRSRRRTRTRCRACRRHLPESQTPLDDRRVNGRARRPPLAVDKHAAARAPSLLRNAFKTATASPQRVAVRKRARGRDA